MKKILCLLVLTLTTSSCSFIIDSDISTPGSKHIPSIDTGRDVFSTLQGTVWKSDSYSAEQDVYLYIDEYEDKYAIKPEKKGVQPDRYPEDHEYTALAGKQPLSGTSLKFYNTAVFEKKEQRRQYIGFYLKDRFTLDVAESSGSITTLITSLEGGTGSVWKLYNY